MTKTPDRKLPRLNPYPLPQLPKGYPGPSIDDPSFDEAMLTEMERRVDPTMDPATIDPEARAKLPPFSAEVLKKLRNLAPPDRDPRYLVGMQLVGMPDRDKYNVLHREDNGAISVISPSCTMDEATTMAVALNARFYPEEASEDELREFARQVMELATRMHGSSKQTLTHLMATLRSAQEMP